MAFLAAMCRWLNRTAKRREARGRGDGVESRSGDVLEWRQIGGVTNLGLGFLVDWSQASIVPSSALHFTLR